MIDLSLHDVAHACDGRIGNRCHAQDVQRVADRGERIAQFVRQRREKLVLSTVGIAQRLLDLVTLGDVTREKRLRFKARRGVAPRLWRGGRCRCARRDVLASLEMTTPQ